VSGQTGNLTVSTVNQTGQSITGYWVGITDASGNIITTGFSTAQFALRPGNYFVEVGDYGGEYFNHWSDGSTNRSYPITITSSSSTNLTAVYCTMAGCQGPSILINSTYSNSTLLTGISVMLQQNSTQIVATGSTPASFAVTSGETYLITVEDYTNAYFYQWSDGVCSSSRSVLATSSQTILTAIYTTSPETPPSCSPSSSSGITVSAHRIPASYWAPCFAFSCSAGTGPGTTMYFVLYDSNGNIVATAFADENGYTFTGLNPGSTYYVYPAYCDSFHNSTHDVLF